ncbi:hypothetical protein CPB83DRAFT_838193 [Crepidotus variabilis]|uniref:Uncharacterized protein n=1 Tax=Crepidotus variabilis TaxID=179855 RepID=A0A9P6EAG9_9AGAR|nr:hypothetical protein CPB83DRAFT_838193 [Crepidotus variabilis]
MDYTEEDLRNLTKKQLAAIIRPQIECWPTPIFNFSKTKLQAMKDAILDKKNGFQKPPSQADGPLNNPQLQPERDAPTAAAQTPGIGGDDDDKNDENENENEREEDRQEQEPEPHITIDVFLEDERCMPSRKSAIQVTLPVLMEVESASKDRCVLATPLMAQIQASHSAIRGPARLAFPFPRRPSFRTYFATLDRRDEDLAQAVCNPDRVCFADESSIEIYIEPLPDAECGRVSGATPSQSAAAPAVSLPAAAQTVHWLHSQALLADGYQLFVDSRSRVLQNPDIVRVWKFTDDFHHEHHRKTHDTPSGTARITKQMIQEALDIRETSLADALNGMKLIKLYGSGGTDEAGDVVKELGQNREKPLGRLALLQFLQQWQKNYPVSRT